MLCSCYDVVFADIAAGMYVSQRVQLMQARQIRDVR